jgi:hypothetical protein
MSEFKSLWHLKQNYSEFLDLILQFYFIVLTETKTEDADSIKIPGCTVFTKNRHKLSKVVRRYCFSNEGH